jgi:hypothetical protein
MSWSGRRKGLSNRGGGRLPLVEHKERRDNNESEAHAVVPFEFVAQIKRGQHRKDGKHDDFLNGFSCAVENSYDPMRFAGTWKQHSKKATPLLRRTTFHNAARRCFKCPYQAMAMITLET